MGEPQRNPASDGILEPDVANLSTEGGVRAQDPFRQKQWRLLTEPLLSCWAGPPGGEGFFLAANVGVFPTAHTPLVADVVLSFDTSPHAASDSTRRSYLLWEHGKPPDVVIEIASDLAGAEPTANARGYERMRVTHYVVFDPGGRAGNASLKRFVLREGVLVPQDGPLWLARVGIGLTVWEGEYEGERARWLRWCTRNGLVVPTIEERAEAEGLRAEGESRRAEAESTATPEAKR